jgi:hypothetical protein
MANCRDSPLASPWQRHCHMLDPGQIIHWTLCHADRRLTCVERVIPAGLECSILYDGLPVAMRVLSVGREVEAWAGQIRRAWELAGWLNVGPGRSSAPVS